MASAGTSDDAVSSSFADCAVTTSLRKVGGGTGDLEVKRMRFLHARNKGTDNIQRPDRNSFSRSYDSAQHATTSFPLSIPGGGPAST
jgi:hypothetical protein